MRAGPALQLGQGRAAAEADQMLQKYIKVRAGEHGCRMKRGVYRRPARAVLGRRRRKVRSAHAQPCQPAVPFLSDHFSSLCITLCGSSLRPPT